MALMTPEINGARQELPYLESPEINGARQEVAVVEKYVDGTWQEVWANAMPFWYISHTTKTGFAACSGELYQIGTIDDAGNVLLGTTESDIWENPTIKLCVSGGISYYDANDNQVFLQGSVLDIWGIKEGESSQTWADIHKYIGSTTGKTEKEEVSATLSGTYKQIGIRVTFFNKNVSPDSFGLSVLNDAVLEDIRIDGRKCEKPDNESQWWYDYGDM